MAGRLQGVVLSPGVPLWRPFTVHSGTAPAYPPPPPPPPPAPPTPSSPIYDEPPPSYEAVVGKPIQ